MARVTRKRWNMDTQKNDIIEALRRFIAQRPGLEPGNYISGWNDAEGRRLYRAESRQITRDRHDAEALLWYAKMCGVTGAQLANALNRRLTWDGARLSYCTGQYFPTEYRRAAASALASALWYYWCDNIGPGQEDTAEKIRKRAHNVFNARIARRFFR